MTTVAFQLESLAYQTDAVHAVVHVFDGTPKAQVHELADNRCPLCWDQLEKNIRDIANRNRISDERLNLTAPAQGQPIDVCVEMETGTGKTLVYLRTLYRLHSVYGWNKFIIVVPSVAIRAGVMGTLADFGEQLTPIAEVTANQLYRARDQQTPPREAIVCFDTSLHTTTLEWLGRQKGQRVIVLEAALDTTAKWNLHHQLGDGLVVF